MSLTNVGAVNDQPDAQSDDGSDNEIEIDGDGGNSIIVPINSPGRGGLLECVLSRAQSIF